MIREKGRDLGIYFAEEIDAAVKLVVKFATEQNKKKKAKLN